MKDNIVGIEDRDVGPGGKVTGLFFGFILLIIAVWGVVIEPLDNKYEALEKRVELLEQRCMINVLLDATDHARLDERVTTLEEDSK